MLTFLDDLAVVEVLVDHAFGRPVEGIAQQAGGVLGQGAHAQPDGAYPVELGGEAGSHDAHKSRCEAALGRHHGGGRLAQLSDSLSGGHVLSEVEVVDPQGVGDLGDLAVAPVGQAGEHRLEGGQQAVQAGGVGHVRPDYRMRAAPSQGAVVDAGDLEAGCVQQPPRQLAHLAESQHRDPTECHEAAPRIVSSQL